MDNDKRIQQLMEQNAANLKEIASIRSQQAEQLASEKYSDRVPRKSGDYLLTLREYGDDKLRRGVFNIAISINHDYDDVGGLLIRVTESFRPCGDIYYVAEEDGKVVMSTENSYNSMDYEIVDFEVLDNLD